jgi:hypothetical protein
VKWLYLRSSHRVSKLPKNPVFFLCKKIYKKSSDLVAVAMTTVGTVPPKTNMPRVARFVLVHDIKPRKKYNI